MLKYSYLLLLLTILSFHKPSTSKHFKIQQLCPGVWAAINNDEYGHAICNAGIIDLGDKTLIFDPFMNLDAAETLKQVAQELTGKKVSYVVDSHYHNDHIRGNQVFLPATIISTYWTRDAININEPKELADEKQNAPQALETSRRKLKTAQGKDKEELPLWIGYFEGMIKTGPLIKTTLPNLCFKDSLWIYGTQRSIKLVECKNGHTKSDAILILPKEGIVFTGDLLFVKRHPWLGDGDPASWMKHLENLSADSGLHQFVPGHGPIGSRVDINTLHQYIQDLRNLVAEQIQQPDSILNKIPVPTAYSNWFYSRFFIPNLIFLKSVSGKE